MSTSHPWEAAAVTAARERRRRRLPARKTELRRNAGGTTAARKRESLSGPLGAKAGRRGDAAVAACGAVTAHAAECTLGEEAATTLGGAAGLPAMVPRTQLTTVDSETDFTAPDIRAEDRKAAAADIADGSSAVDLTAGVTPTEAGKEQFLNHGSYYVVP
jgi:hypothetical protein